MSRAPAPRWAFPGSTATRKSSNPGIPSFTVSQFTGLSTSGTNWYQFDTTFQASDVLAWNRGSHNVRAGFDLRRLATGRRAANDARGLFNFTGDMSGYAMADFMMGISEDRYSADRSDSGARRRLAQRVLHQRQLAAETGPDAEPRAALRAEHAGTDVCRCRRHAGRRLPDDHSVPESLGLSGQGVPVHRGQQQGLGAAAGRHVSDQRQNGRQGGFRDLLQPEPDEFVYVPD